MKRIYANTSVNDENISLDEIPDIDGEYYDVNVILDWIDTLEEVHNNESNSSDK